nr:MAG TPA: hypothetical protein [Caudoviricetes sp.]
MRGLSLQAALFLRAKISDVADACLRFVYTSSAEYYLTLFTRISFLACIAAGINARRGILFTAIYTM